MDDKSVPGKGPDERRVRPGAEAIRLAEWIEGDMTCLGDAEIAAELRRQYAEIERLRIPLTSQQLDKLIEAHVGGAELADGEYSAMVLFAAAVERAHGIRA